MPLQLKRKKSLRKSIRAALRKLRATALDGLAADTTSATADGVHEARKAIKKMRAILRLVRPALAGKIYRTANLALRDAARPLSTVRDAKVLADLIEQMTAQLSLQPDAALDTIHKDKIQDDLAVAAREARSTATTPGGPASLASEQLAELSDLLSAAADVPSRWSSLGKGLAKTYRRARRAYAAAAAEPNEANLHNWRKDVKYLRYQWELLRPLCPDRLAPLAAAARHLGELLGDDHDLAVLRQFLSANHADSASFAPLLNQIDLRQAAFRGEALALGKSLFAPHPAELTKPLKSAWKTWQQTTPTEAAA